MKSPALERVYFGKYPYNLIRSCNLQKYYQLLCNFDFLLGKIQHQEFGVQALIEDYDLLDDSDAKNHPDCNLEAVKALRLIQGALRLSAHVLVEDSTQLASQLWGRLQGFNNPNIHSLLEQINQNQTVWLRPLKSGLIPSGSRLQRVFTGHRSSINAIAITPDGKQIVSGAEDGIIKVWDLATGKELLSLIGHRSAVTAIIVTPDGKQVISGSKDGTLTIWNLASGQELFTMSEREYFIETIAVTSDSKRVTTSGWSTRNRSNHRIITWNLQTRHKKVILKSYIDTIALAPNGVKAILCSTNSNEGSITGILRIKKLKDRSVTSKAEDLEVNSKDNIKLKGHTDKITVVAITADSNSAISGSKDKTLIVWDLETKQQRLTLTGHRDEITLVAISDCGKKAVSGSKDKTIKIWDLETGTEICTFNDISNTVNSVVIASNSKQAFTGSTDKNIKVWNIKEKYKDFSYKNLSSNKLNDLSVNDLFVRYIYIVCSVFIIYTILVYNWVLISKIIITLISKIIIPLVLICPCLTYVYLILFPLVNSFYRMTFKINLINVNQQGNQAANHWLEGLNNFEHFTKIYNYSGFIKGYLMFSQNIWPKYNVKQLISLSGHSDSITALAVTPDNKHVISSSNDKTIRLWDLKTGNQLSILSGHRDQVSSIALTSNGELLISSSFDKSIKAWKTKTLKKVFQLKSCSLIAHDIFHITINTVWVFIGIFIGFAISKHYFIFIKKYFLMFPFDSIYIIFGIVFLLLWCIDIFKFIYQSIDNFIDENNCDQDSKLIITPDNKRAITGSRDKTLKIWDLTTRRQIYTLRGHKDWIASVAVTLDSKYLISSSKDTTLKVWNLITLKELFTLKGHDSSVTAVAVTPDGLRAISGSSNGSLKVWDLESRKEILTIDGHRNSVEAIAVIPDGKHLVSAASDHTLRVWNLLTGKEITRFTADTPLTSCAIAPEGTTIVAGDQVGQLHFLRLEGIGASR